MEYNDKNHDGKVTRRKILKVPAKTLVGLYVAPVTMSLLMARRVTALSVQQVVRNVNIINDSGTPYNVRYQTPAGEVTDPVPPGANTFQMLCPSDFVLINLITMVENSQHLDCTGSDTWSI